MNLQVTWETLLAIAGGVVLLLNAGKAIIQLFDPFKELKQKQEEQEHFLKNDKSRLDDLEEEVRGVHEALSVVGLALAEMINHELTGNDEAALKRHQQNLDEYFYQNNKKGR